MTIQPPLFPFVLVSNTLQTTPFPKRTRTMVPKNSAKNGFIVRTLGKENCRISLVVAKSSLRGIDLHRRCTSQISCRPSNRGEKKESKGVESTAFKNRLSVRFQKPGVHLKVLPLDIFFSRFAPFSAIDRFAYRNLQP
jgi:hypothetical protein